MLYWLLLNTDMHSTITHASDRCVLPPPLWLLTGLLLVISFPFPPCSTSWSATRFLLHSPMCSSCCEHQSWCTALESPCSGVTEGSWCLTSSCSRFESANHKQGHWLPSSYSFSSALNKLDTIWKWELSNGLKIGFFLGQQLKWSSCMDRWLGHRHSL